MGGPRLGRRAPRRPRRARCGRLPRRARSAGPFDREPAAAEPRSGAEVSKLVRRLVLVVLLGVLIYAVLVVARGVGSVAATFRGYAWWTFGAACTLAFTNYLLRFLKWEYYLAVLGIRGVPKGESLLTFLSGFVLTVTPGKVGEVFK